MHQIITQTLPKPIISLTYPPVHSRRGGSPACSAWKVGANDEEVESSGGRDTAGGWGCGGACSPALSPLAVATRSARSNRGGPVADPRPARPSCPSLSCAVAAQAQAQAQAVAPRRWRRAWGTGRQSRGACSSPLPWNVALEISDFVGEWKGRTGGFLIDRVENEICGSRVYVMW